MNTEPSTVQDQKTPRQRGRIARWALKSLKVLTLALIVLTATGVIYEAVSGFADGRRHPAPGKLYDVGGYRLHLHCTGEGSPTVILEAGLSRDSLDWSWVQPGLAEHTRVCTYDRAGAGWSDAGPLPRDSQTIAGELHALLDEAGVTDPLLLVGHSAGGSHVQLFEHRYPERVAGMVLVDVTHRENARQQPPPKAMVAVFKSLRFLGALRLLRPLDNSDLPEAAAKAEDALVLRPHFINTMVAENVAVTENLRQVAEVGVDGSLGDLPLVVLTATQVPDPLPKSMTADEAREDRALCLKLQREMLAMSSNSRQVLAEASGHEIQKDEPELVIEVVADLVEELRQASPSRVASTGAVL